MFRKILFALIIFSSYMLAQLSDEINNKFDKAVKDFDSKKWDSASQLFNQIAYGYPKNSKTSLAFLFVGKIGLELKNFAAAEKAINNLMKEYPNSKYVDEAKQTLAKIYFEQKKYFKSFWLLCDLMMNSNDYEYRFNSKELAENLALNYLSAAELKAFHDSTKLSDLKPFLLLLRSKIYISQNNKDLAQESLLKLIRTYPNSEEKDEAQLLYDKIKINMASNFVSEADIIVVLLPISGSGSNTKAAKEILEGIKYSLNEFNSTRDNKVAIIIRDTELNRNKLEIIYEELREIENLKCIIGPIFSSEVRDALEIFKEITVPIISPTATDDYLINLHQNFFQANPSFSMRGRLMAQYIYYVENKRKIGILNSVDGYSPILSSSFSQEFERLGGKILFREAYRSGTLDLSMQVQKIAANLNQIEGLYIPLSDRVDIPIIISSLSQLNLNIPVYGDQDWMNPLELGSAAFLDNNLIFCSDYYIKFEDPDYQKFTKDYFEKTKTEVNRNVLYGYDAMKFVLTCIRTAGFGTSSLKQKMISGITSAGYKNNISFDSNRINKYLNIIRYTKGRFELINKFKLVN